MFGNINRRDLLVFLSFAVFLVLPPFLLGGVYSHTGTNIFILFTTALISAAYFVRQLAAEKKTVISPFVFPLAAIWLFSLFQLIPLPIPLLKLLSPQGAVFHVLECADGTRPLTMSVTDTIYSSFRILALIFFSTIVANDIFFYGKKWKQLLIDTIILTSAAVILVSAALSFMQAEKWLYGTLRHTGFLLDSIIINTNHAANFYGISGLLALTSIYTTTFPRKKIFYVALFFLHSAAVATTLSRAGISAYICSVVLCLILNRNNFHETGKNRFLLPFSAIFMTFLFVFLTGIGLLESEFDMTRANFFSKIENFSTVKNYFADFFPAGSGLGSFSKVFPFYQSNPERYLSELENEPLQFILETGLAFALIIFISFILVFLLMKRKSKRTGGIAAILFFVILHNTMDFNLHNFSTLFSIAALSAIILKPVEIKGKIRNVFLVFLIALSLTAIVFTATENGRELLGYPPETPYSYEKAVYMQPADFRIPLNKAMEKINSSDKAIFASAGKEVSAAFAKAPKYYYTHYLNGVYLLGIGAENQALEFFGRSLDLSKGKYEKILNKIYARLLYFGAAGRITEIIRPTESNKKVLEKFILTNSDSDKNIADFAEKNQEIFFVFKAKNLIKQKEYRKSAEFIEEILSKNRQKLSDSEYGMLLIFKGDIAKAEKSYEKAFKLYIQGAKLTNRFNDFLTAANCSLFLDSKYQNSADDLMKNMILQNSTNLGNYYRWLSKREFAAQNISAGFKYLERAAEVAKNPYWQLEVANMYAKRGMHYFAAQNLLKITMDYPEFQPEEMKKRYEDEKKKMERDEEKNLKELMFREKK